MLLLICFTEKILCSFYQHDIENEPKQDKWQPRERHGRQSKDFPHKRSGHGEYQKATGEQNAQVKLHVRKYSVR
jgi:hypothetical protein